MLEIGHAVSGDSLIKAGGAVEFLQQLSAVDAPLPGRANPSAATLAKEGWAGLRPQPQLPCHEYLERGMASALLL